MGIPEPRRPVVRPANVLGTAILASALAGGCVGNASDSGGSGSAVEDDAPRLRTGGSAYVFTRDGVWERTGIDFVYENRGPDTLYQPTCRPNGGDPGLSMAVQKRVENGWENVWAPVLPACLSEPIEVPPGGTYRDTLEVALHPQDSTHQPRFNTEVEIAGTYRLIWLQLLRTYDPDSYPFGEEVADSLRVSNPFELSR